MNELQVFTNNDFGEIRVIEENGNVLFCGSDVARALGYQNPSRDVKRHCKSPVARCTTDSVGRQQEMLFIPEADLYRLAFRSNLPSAERLTDWVAEEVIPSIRKTGGYGTPAMFSTLSPQLQTLINIEMRQQEHPVSNIDIRTAPQSTKTAFLFIIISPPKFILPIDFLCTCKYNKHVHKKEVNAHCRVQAKVWLEDRNLIIRKTHKSNFLQIDKPLQT